MIIDTNEKLNRAHFGGPPEKQNVCIFNVPMLDDDGNPRPIEQVEDEVLMAIVERKVERNVAFMDIISSLINRYIDRWSMNPEKLTPEKLIGRLSPDPFEVMAREQLE